MEWTALVIALLMLLLGFPLMIALLAGALILWFTYLPETESSILVQQLVSSVEPYVLLAIPLFIFAADIMSAGRTSQHLLTLVQKTIGRMKGGIGVATAAAATGFGAVSGSSQATVAAIGPPMRKEALRAEYKDSHILALLINSSGLALLIPPSTVLIYYGTLTSTSVGNLFLAGIIPGLAIFLFFAAYEHIVARFKGLPTAERASRREKLWALFRAAPTLGLPVLILGSIYAGVATPTEAAALAVVYAAALELFLYRSIRFRDLGSMAASTATITSVIFILLAAGGAVSWVISYAQIPQTLADVVLGADPSQVVVLLIMAAFFLVACMFVDSLVAIAILTPIFSPIALEVGADPVYIGVIITLQAAIGAVTPPFGVNIFTASAIFKVPYLTVVKGVGPYIAILLAANLLFILVPEIVLAYEYVLPSD